MRNIKPVDLSKLIEPFAGQWVALTPDEKKFLGASLDLNEALRKAKSKGVSRPLIIKSPGYEMMGFLH